MRIKYLWSFSLFNAKSNPFQVKFNGICLQWFNSPHYEYDNENSDQENELLSRSHQLNPFFLVNKHVNTLKVNEGY